MYSFVIFITMYGRVLIPLYWHTDDTPVLVFHRMNTHVVFKSFLFSLFYGNKFLTVMSVFFVRASVFAARRNQLGDLQRPRGEVGDETPF